jgi:vesicle coat complex subunit
MVQTFLIVPENRIDTNSVNDENENRNGIKLTIFSFINGTPFNMIFLTVIRNTAPTNIMML